MLKKHSVLIRNYAIIGYNEEKGDKGVIGWEK